MNYAKEKMKNEVSRLQEFKDRLKMLRKEKKLTQVKLGEMLNYGYTAIANYESGRNQPSIPDLKKIAVYSTLVMYIVMLITAYINPSILGFIESLGGPIIAAILFLMPIIAIYTVSKMKKFQNKALDAFVFITGVLTIITVITYFRTYACRKFIL